MTGHESPRDFRDRLAVALCNFILRTLGTRRYRMRLDAVIRAGLRPCKVSHERKEGGEHMAEETLEKSGKRINVTYEVTNDLDEQQMRELIQSNSPSGFLVESVEIDEGTSAH